MNKDLPNVFAGNINEDINNVQEIFYGSRNLEEKQTDNLSIDSKINRIFNSPNYVYKKEVLLKTNDGDFRKIIIGKTNGQLLTFDNEKIDIKDINDIETI